MQLPFFADCEVLNLLRKVSIMKGKSPQQGMTKSSAYIEPPSQRPSRLALFSGAFTATCRS